MGKLGFNKVYFQSVLMKAGCLLALLKQCRRSVTPELLLQSGVEEADRLRGRLSRGYRGYAWSSILNQSPDSQWSAITAQKLSCSALICLQLEPRYSSRPSSVCWGSLSGDHCPVGAVHSPVGKRQHLLVKASFETDTVKSSLLNHSLYFPQPILGVWN